MTCFASVRVWNQLVSRHPDRKVPKVYEDQEQQTQEMHAALLQIFRGQIAIPTRMVGPAYHSYEQEALEETEDL